MAGVGVNAWEKVFASLHNVDTGLFGTFFFCNLLICCCCLMMKSGFGSSAAGKESCQCCGLLEWPARPEAEISKIEAPVIWMVF